MAPTPVFANELRARRPGSGLPPPRRCVPSSRRTQRQRTSFQMSSRGFMTPRRTTHITPGRLASAPRSIPLHTARICGGATVYAILRGSREAAFRPVGPHLHLVPAPLQLGDGRGGSRPSTTSTPGARCAARTSPGSARCATPVHRSLPAGSCAAPRCRGARGAGSAGSSTVLLVAAGRAPRHVGFALAQCQPHRQRRARTLARRERGRLPLFEPEHLSAGAERPPERRDQGDDCSQPPEGVAVNMLPALSMMSMCTVSPTTRPSSRVFSAWVPSSRTSARRRPRPRPARPSRSPCRRSPRPCPAAAPSRPCP